MIVTYLVFLLLFCINILFNMDQGLILGSYRQIKNKLSIDDVQFGLLGSSVFAGRTIGCACSQQILAVGTRIKPVLTISIVFVIVCHYMFT